MPLHQIYHGRRAASIENESVRVTVLAEGGHIAEVFDKQTGVNPLWTPPWPSIEPSTYDPALHRDTYGAGAEAILLAGIMGHNVCLDIFGGPSIEEAASGLTVHGDAPVAPYAISASDDGLRLEALLPLAQIRFERFITLRGRAVGIRESNRACSHRSSAPPTICGQGHGSNGPTRRGRTVASRTCACSPTSRGRAPTPPTG